MGKSPQRSGRPSTWPSGRLLPSGHLMRLLLTSLLSGALAAAPHEILPAPRQGLGQALAQFCQASYQLGIEVHPEDSAPMSLQGFHVAERLSLLEDPEPVRRSGRGASWSLLAVIIRNSPVFGPPLWSWPVE